MDVKILGGINSPNDLKQLNNEQIGELCSEIRSVMLSTVSENGGHLASNLGAVELTVALHKVFESPKDTIVFDVGHQCYTHKLLTGRYENFSTLRTENGISGFMKPEESEHDPFITGHSSTSLSSAFGVCKANEILGDKGLAIAVLGDGALTGGMVYEAFNNVQKKDSRLIVVLNDNKMSISKNRGSLSKHLSVIRTQKKYFKFKTGVERFLIKIPLIGNKLCSFAVRLKMMIKNALYESNIFESLGFYYMGPVDGHDIKKLTEMFEVAKNYDRPVLVHVKTVKGKGYAFAETNPGDYHGVSRFDINEGLVSSGKPNFSSVFGDTLCELARTDNKICAVTAAMMTGTGLKNFANEFKNRFFDVGIAEEHAVTFSAGLAKKGMKPIFAVYSTFLQRGYDQIIHDTAIAGVPVTFAVDRAGFVGDDGETHQGLFDVAFLSTIPGVKIYAPADFNELKLMLKERLRNPKGVAAIRYPRGGTDLITENPSKVTETYKVYGSGDTALVTYGTLVHEAFIAKNELKDIAVIKLDILSPIDDSLITELSNYKKVLFFEEGILNGSVAQKVGFKLMEKGFKGVYKAYAVEGFVKQASVLAQRKHNKLDCASMIEEVKIIGE
jgi:1-deoxy-D-xylulose-5-phosphate synthase